MNSMDSVEASDHNVTAEMVQLVPQLHTFARSLCRDGVHADDLVQEALLRAIDNIERFKPGTNLKAWLFTIVRNEHYSQLRRRKFEAHDVSSDSLPEPSVPPDHDGELELRDLNRALAALSPGQRAALLLVSASGFSYEEAAAICGCAVGTIKSRVARARSALLAMLEGCALAPACRSSAERATPPRRPAALSRPGGSRAYAPAMSSAASAY
ncbi:MAG TPA: sigma-70 family RNA polymerase sigma factor [Steroidobacteraceae bacterium]|nr:sigma-70 family RNA polymerase sigma factor [Steroidobacteraceae bacterium]